MGQYVIGSMPQPGSIFLGNFDDDEHLEVLAATGASNNGAVAGGLDVEHSYVVSWMESDRKGTYAINLRGLTADGQVGRMTTVGRTSVARAVPQMIRVRDKLVLAWTDEMNELSKVVSVKVRITGFYD